jgi:hypothetical protein
MNSNPPDIKQECKQVFQCLIGGRFCIGINEAMNGYIRAKRMQKEGISPTYRVEWPARALWPPKGKEADWSQATRILVC